jgi:hypothetical protein
MAGGLRDGEWVGEGRPLFVAWRQSGAIAKDCLSTSLPFKDVRAMPAIRGEADKICSL